MFADTAAMEDTSTVVSSMASFSGATRPAVRVLRSPKVSRHVHTVPRQAVHRPSPGRRRALHTASTCPSVDRRAAVAVRPTIDDVPEVPAEQRATIALSVLRARLLDELRVGEPVTPKNVSDLYLVERLLDGWSIADVVPAEVA